MFGFRLLYAASVCFTLHIVPSAAQDLSTEIETALTGLSAGFPEGETAGFNAAITAAPAGITGDTFGHALFAQRHFDRAAWFFGSDAVGDLSDPASLNNFSAMLVQTYLNDPDSYPIDWLATAHLASEQAVALAPNEAAFHNNLAQVLRHLGQDAVASARRATELAPEETLYWDNLARALEASGDSEGAAAALARSHAISPNALSLQMARASMPNVAGSYTSAIQPNCNVNFGCEENCPRSIIGRIMFVTCEIENQSAQLACLEGLPHPTSYRCEEEFPEYGILIPGLNSGFSVAVPGFSMHVLVNGDGTIRTRVEFGASAGPLTAYAGTDGRFQPDGGVSFDNNRAGVRLSLLNRSPAAQQASNLGHPPAHIELENVDGDTSLNAEAYNAGVISY
ncbi:tetratricopeptide repeat protein [Cochlodiniinecator piscidefendens]|uniref:hypothetical protein n=1 Tax=Cochlodiniinecator piscidefendens TaxID=2715756 RepID=UPI0014097428|nr:hypothetical protein [Cochlodiniinecator piscidefendens]